MTHLYQTEAYFHQRFREVGRSHAFHAQTEADWRIWRANLRARLCETTGLHRMVPTAMNPRLTETIECDGYIRQHMEIDTEPGVTMPVYVLIPDDVVDDAAVIIACHGHGGEGKRSVAGVADDRAARERIDQYNYDYGVQCVRRGHIVFCPDARGFGERRESLSAADEQRFDSSCRQLAHMALPLGLTVIGMWIWDLQVLLTYIQSLPDAAGRRIGCIGLSGGGYQALWLAALDDRVDCAVVSGYFYGVEDSLLHLAGNCDCNYVPHLWETADMGDIAALLAPRPLLIETARQDSLNGPRGVENVDEQYAITERVYRLLDVSDRLARDTFDGGHEWHGVVVQEWLDRWLRGE